MTIACDVDDTVSEGAPRETQTGNCGGSETLFSVMDPVKRWRTGKMVLILTFTLVFTYVIITNHAIVWEWEIQY
jgi:hypothetical protein